MVDGCAGREHNAIELGGPADRKVGHLAGKKLQSYSRFLIVEREGTTARGSYRSRQLCLAHMSPLAAGDPDAEIRR
jgi:hypothetical protein